MRERLRASAQPSHDVDVLAELFAEDLEPWPDDAWLAIDDYHLMTGAGPSESFVEALSSLPSLRLCITSRRRPSWVTARRRVYGEICELDRRLLAMTSEEAHLVLTPARDPNVEHFLTYSRGWPALVGLAAVTGLMRFPREDVAEALYDFVADELFQLASHDLRAKLPQLALVPSITPSLADNVFGHTSGRRLLEQATTLGFLTTSEIGGDSYELHPLLRAFLIRKLEKLDRRATRSLAAKFVEHLIRERRWDDVFEIASVLDEPQLVLLLAEASSDALLAGGRVATLSRILELADDLHLDDPVLDLCAAELAYREGLHAKAEALSLRSAQAFGADHQRRARALIRAGQAALQGNEAKTAAVRFSEARKLATEDSDVREALVGSIFSALDLEVDDAFALVAELRRTEDVSVEGMVRRMAVELMISIRTGGMDKLLERARAILDLAKKSGDPIGYASFLNSLAHGLALSARYHQSLDVVNLETDFVKRYRLDFALPHAALGRSIASLGLRDFSGAAAAIQEVRRFEADLDDPHLLFNAAAIECRLELARGNYGNALDVVSSSAEPIPSAGLRAEYLACRALALAVHERTEQAVEVAGAARGTTRWQIEARTLCACVEVISVIQAGGATDNPVAALFATLHETGCVDSFICAARAYPPLAQTVNTEGRYRELVHSFVRRASDSVLARECGIALDKQDRDHDSALSPREQEVHRLLAQGLTNREIAQTLVISEKTVKVHVRHIYEKLGVRGRVEAALKRRTRDHDGA